MHIGVDIMGSDSSPYTLFESILRIIDSPNPSPFFEVYASNEVIRNVISTYSNSILEKISFCLASNEASSCDESLYELIKNSDTSMSRGLQALKEGNIDAFVTAGETRALMVTSKIHLSMISSIKRPALLATFPSFSRGFAVLDVGANLSYKAEYLVQYAAMGVIHQKIIKGVSSPIVALLNVGSESSKGSIEQRKVFDALKKMSNKGLFTFIGNVEGSDVFKKKIDVLVTDGFTGNVLLKTAEGTADYIFDQVDRLSLIEEDKKCIHDYKKKFQEANDYGAVLIGVQGVVVKCHGNATIDSFYCGILDAIELVEKKFLHSLFSVEEML